MLIVIGPTVAVRSMGNPTGLGQGQMYTSSLVVVISEPSQWSRVTG